MIGPKPIHTQINSASSGTAVSVNTPLRIQEGDFILLVMNVNDVPTITDNNGNYAFSSFTETNYSGFSGRVKIFYRFATASEPSNYNFTLSGSKRWAVICTAYRYVDEDNPFNVSPESLMNVGAGIGPKTLRMMVTKKNVLGITFAAIDTNINPFTTPADHEYTLIATLANQALSMSYRLISIDPPINFPSVNWVLSGSLSWATVQFALNPARTPLVQKHFIYRVFADGAYVATWTKEVLSEPRFKATINGGSGEMIIELGRRFDDFGEDVDVKLNNKVECWVVDKDTPNGSLLYCGYISGYKPSVQEAEEKVEITVLGYIAELQRTILRDASGNTSIAYNSYDPSHILKDVIDKYRALGGSINYSPNSIQNTNTTVSYTFNTNTIKECLDKIIELCPEGWYWRVDPDSTIYLQPKNIMADHEFTLGLDVENLETFRRVEDLTNRVLFIGAGNPALFRKYENTGSQDTYGLYEKKIVDQRVSTVATAQIMAEREINSKKDPEIRSRFTIIDNNGPKDNGYNIESIKPGQTLKVKNLKSAIRTITLWDVALWDVDVWDQTLETSAADVIQILSVDYTPDSIDIEASSRLPQIAKRIEDVQRNLEVTQVVNNPVAPT